MDRTDNNMHAVASGQNLPSSASSFHSGEVHAIMGRQPSWILRWGVTLILLILAGIIVGCWFIRYPQTVTAAITLTSDNPPADLAARVSGILDTVYVSDGDTVSQGELIALVASAARYDDIMLAEGLLRRIGESDDVGGADTLPELAAMDAECPAGKGCAMNHGSLDTLRLGDLQDEWTGFLSTCSDYCDHVRIDRTGRTRRLLAGQIWRAKEYYGRLEAQRSTIVQELEYERRGLERDSLLLSRRAISKAEYDTSMKNYISKKNTLAGFDATMSSAHMSRLQLEQQMLELELQESGESAEYMRRIAEGCGSLLGKIALWKEQYAVTAPYDGTVSLQNVWSRGQRVSVGDVIASVSPLEGPEIIGRLKVPSSGFGKVEVGQEVNIQLSGFPYLEFGIIRGEVKSISTVPEKTDDGIAYTVEVELPDGLESTYHRILPFVSNMDGTAEIITEDMRLIEQFTRPVKSLFVNR